MLRQKKASHSEQNERQSGYQRDTYSHYENQRRDTMRLLLNQNRYPQGKASQEKRNDGKQSHMPGKSSTGSKTGSPGKPGAAKHYPKGQYETICSGRPYFTMQEHGPPTAATPFRKNNDPNVYTSIRTSRISSGTCPRSAPHQEDSLSGKQAFSAP